MNDSIGKDIENIRELAISMYESEKVAAQQYNRVNVVDACVSIFRVGAYFEDQVSMTWLADHYSRSLFQEDLEIDKDALEKAEMLYKKAIELGSDGAAYNLAINYKRLGDSGRYEEYMETARNMKNPFALEEYAEKS